MERDIIEMILAVVMIAAVVIFDRRAARGKRPTCHLVYGGITEWNDGEYVSANWYCSECGGTLPASAEYCLHCGRKVVGE